MNNSYIPYYEASVERSTWRSRESGLKTMRDRFKGVKLRDITVQDCESFKVWLLSSSGYSQAYCSLMYGMFRKTLDYAVMLQYVDENISKRTKVIAKGRSVVSFWTKEEFEKVLSVIFIKDFYENMCFVMIWLYYMTGIRVSEELALNWNDIDLEKKKLRVHHTLDMVNQNNFERKPYTKTEEGRRMVSLDDDTIKILRQWKQVQKELGVENFVISYTDLPLYRSTVQRIIERYAKIAKVHKIQGKGLRHSHVSYLINEFNADVLNVSKRLGHSSPEITLKHYAHFFFYLDCTFYNSGHINCLVC
ncbi:tyrosine-type recombinase/integrase [Listeria booriae]|uniref:tyrosine-type recombinase/integrase n=1 Tax=Listeria booriae TaxID=1552123 RepID=UPI001C894BBC|nr:site-specific integrase [Listeria booriae]